MPHFSKERWWEMAEKARDRLARTTMPVSRFKDRKFEERLRLRIDQGAEAMQAWITRTQQNLAYFVGLQDKVIVADVLVDAPQGADWESVVVVNHLRKLVNAMRCRLLSDDPRAVITPRTSEPRAIVSAHLSNKVLRANEDRINYEDLLQEQILTLLLSGGSFWYTYWDKDVSLQSPGGAWSRLGAPVTRSLTVGEVVIDPMAPSFEEARWYAIRQVYPIEWVEENFPNGRFVASDGSERTAGAHGVRDIVTGLAQSLFGGPTHRQNDGTLDPLTDRAVVVEQYFERHKDKETGRLALLAVKFAGDVVLAPPEVIDWDPVTFATFERLPRHPYPDTLVNDLVGLQEGYNNSRRAIDDNVTINSYPQLLADRASGVDEADLISAPDAVIWWSSAGGAKPPGYLQAPSMLPEVYSHPRTIHEEMMDLAGVHSESLGKQKWANQPYSATVTLQQADVTNLATAAGGVFRGMREVARKTLYLESQFATKPRLLRTEGEGTRQAEEFEFVGKDLGNAQYVKMNISGRPGMDPVRREEMTMQFATLGLLAPERREELRALEKRLGMGGVQEQDVDEMVQALEQAQDENEKWNKGFSGDVVVRPYQEHEIHMQVHRQLLNSREAGRWQDPVLASAENHLLFHELGLALVQQEVANVQAALAPMAAEAA